MAEHDMDEAKGRIKEAAGDLTNDEELKESGENDQRKAAVKEKVEELSDKAKDAVDSVRDKIR